MQCLENKHPRRLMMISYYEDMTFGASTRVPMPCFCCPSINHIANIALIHIIHNHPRIFPKHQYITISATRPAIRGAIKQKIRNTFGWIKIAGKPIAMRSCTPDFLQTGDVLLPCWRPTPGRNLVPWPLG